MSLNIGWAHFKNFGTDVTATRRRYERAVLVGADVVVEASGAEPSIESTLDAVRRGGTVVLVGLADEATVPFDVLEIIDNEIDVYGSFRYKNTYDVAIDLLADGAVDVDGLVDFQSPRRRGRGVRPGDEPSVVKGVITVDV